MSKSNHDDQVDSINYAGLYLADNGLVKFHEKQVTFWDSDKDKISSEAIEAAIKKKALQLESVKNQYKELDVDLNLDKESYKHLLESFKNLGFGMTTLKTQASCDSMFANALKSEMSKVQKSKSDIKTLTGMAMDDCISSGIAVMSVPASMSARVIKFYLTTDYYKGEKYLVEQEVLMAIKTYGRYTEPTEAIRSAITRSIAFCYGWVVSWDTEHDTEMAQLADKSHEIHKEYNRLMEIDE